jgi:hypothetical protein
MPKAAQAQAAQVLPEAQVELVAAPQQVQARAA